MIGCQGSGPSTSWDYAASVLRGPLHLFKLVARETLMSALQNLKFAGLSAVRLNIDPNDPVT
ncbi:hypothetical protein D3C76_1711590 [compost metagenome]